MGHSGGPHCLPLFPMRLLGGSIYMPLRHGEIPLGFTTSHTQEEIPLGCHRLLAPGCAPLSGTQVVISPLPPPHTSRWLSLSTSPLHTHRRPTDVPSSCFRGYTCPPPHLHTHYIYLSHIYTYPFTHKYLPPPPTHTHARYTGGQRAFLQAAPGLPSSRQEHRQQGDTRRPAALQASVR